MENLKFKRKTFNFNSSLNKNNLKITSLYNHKPLKNKKKIMLRKSRYNQRKGINNKGSNQTSRK